jgi:hypothetical protein
LASEQPSSLRKPLSGRFDGLSYLHFHRGVAIRTLPRLSRLRWFVRQNFSISLNFSRLTLHRPDGCLTPWADETCSRGQRILRGPDRCRFNGQIVQSACMPKETFPRRVFSARTFPQLGVI